MQPPIQGGTPTGVPPSYPYPPYPPPPPHPVMYVRPADGIPPGSTPGYPYPPPEQIARGQPGYVPVAAVDNPYQMFYSRSKNTGDSQEVCDFDDARLRNAFIRKVYTILFIQLAITAVFITLCVKLGVICLWMSRNRMYFHISYGVFVVLYFTLACCPNVRRHFPWNYLALFTFTCAFAYLSGAITCQHQTTAVLTAVTITAVSCLTVSLLAITTKIDFTKCTALFLFLSIGLLLFGIACIIVYFVLGSVRILQTVYGGVAACVFVLYLAFDTQLIIGGRKYEMSAEDYIYGALQLYMDIMNLFLIILGLVRDQE